jgi:glycosyltransferase involved in cell wall biosynthesis
VLAGARETETADLSLEARRLLGDRVVILENVPHARMPLLYQAADVHVLCSLMEVMGISIVEAMASGLTNLVHTWGSVEWVVGGTGRVLDMEAPGVLALELRNLDRETCIRQGQLARQRAIDMFSVEAVVEQMLGMYDAVLSGRRVRPRVEPAAVSAGAAV